MRAERCAVQHRIVDGNRALSFDRPRVIAVGIGTRRLADGSLTNAEVFSSKGHGAYHSARDLVSDTVPGMVAVTGPQRHRLRGSPLDPYFAAPFGDMMISGCFGLLRGYGEVYPAAREAIDCQLGPLA